MTDGLAWGFHGNGMGRNGIWAIHLQKRDYICFSLAMLDDSMVFIIA